MTSERKKAIVIIVATLVVGILIGAFGTSILARQHYRGGKKQADKEYRGKRQGFAQNVYRITKADDDQIKQMQPVIDETSTKIDTLQNQTEQQVAVLLDSMNQQLKPFLKAEQFERLDKFLKTKMHHGNTKGMHRQ